MGGRGGLRLSRGQCGTCLAALVGSATRAVALDVARLVTVAAVEVSDLELGKHGLGICVIVAGEMARRRLTPVFIH